LSVLPSELANSLPSHIGAIRDAVRLGGGMVAASSLVVTDKGHFFVKWKTDSPKSFFRLEADGLNRLRATNTLRIPEVIAYADDEDDQFPFLALEYIQPQPPSNPKQFADSLGQGLAALHRIRPTFVGYGLDVDNFLGSQPQRNTPAAAWVEFYRDNRLLPQIQRARTLNLIPPHRFRLLDLLIERLESLYKGHNPESSMIHGDLWAGNLLGAGDQPVLIDPAVYFADREMELAYMQLFSGFSNRIFEAYHASYPIDSDYENRKPLHQLYPLLIHLNHFGEQYGPDVDAVCRYYLSG
jgi:fructosamine-3-kinase